MKLFFYNTINRQQEEFIPIHKNYVGLYTCGPTVYDYAHIGNLRAYVFEDLLRKTLKYLGYNVKQIMNLTDVDDKTIKNSRNSGKSLEEYTQTYKKAFFEDIDSLNIERAEVYPAATEHIDEMIEIIESLLNKGYAYKSEDGSIYFSINKFKNYGKLSKIDFQNQKPGARVLHDEYEKDSVADFALWKAWNQEDGEVYWDSPWGKGRPGWHIECSAMSMKYLGKRLDIHTGGIDNMFPHHEDEIAQSEALNDEKFVNYWLHCEHLIVNGEKMSKSKGNFYTLRDLLNKGYSSSEIRYVLISTHYRKKLNLTFEGLQSSAETLYNFNKFITRLNEVNNEAEIDQAEISKVVDKYKEDFKLALCDDLNISGALAAVFSLQRETNKLFAENMINKESANLILDTFKEFNTVLGIFEFKNLKEGIPEEIIKMAEERQTARKEKNFTKADSLRDKIKEAGWQVEDTPSGPRITKL